MMATSHVSLRKSKDSLIDRFCGYCIGLPFFVELSLNGLGLPQSHAEMNGLPIHSSMIALLLLMPQFKFRTNTLFYTIFFVI